MAENSDSAEKPGRTAAPWMLEMLVCPVTMSSLRYDAMLQELVSDKAGLAFSVREGIPIMLPHEARRIV